ncbi:MAG: hypothetical protein OXP74_07345 [Acidobacteriota bacterium]|nr:hypothetical protein [Acidobacteriota bacterium]
MSEPAREIDYATKADLDVLGAEFRAEIAAVRMEIAKAETRQTWRLLGGFAALLTLFRLFDQLPLG